MTKLRLKAGSRAGAKPGSPRRLLKLKRSPNRLSTTKNRYIKRLNDLHVGTQITVAALVAQRRALAETTEGTSHYRHFVVPSGGKQPVARIRRDMQQMKILLSRMLGTEEYGKSLMLAVSITEDYIGSTLKLILRAYPERINRGIKNGEAETTIGLDELLSKSKEQILDERIQARLVKILYGSPADYLKYLGSVLQIEIDAEAMLAFVEVKATRDILVHLNGFANQVYVEKAGDRQRAKAGEKLVIDEAYFNASIAAMKALISNLHEGVNTRYSTAPLVIAELNRAN